MEVRKRASLVALAAARFGLPVRLDRITVEAMLTAGSAAFACDAIDALPLPRRPSLRLSRRPALYSCGSSHSPS
jgi:hypothetical protein